MKIVTVVFLAIAVIGGFIIARVAWRNMQRRLSEMYRKGGDVAMG